MEDSLNPDSKKIILNYSQGQFLGLLFESKIGKDSEANYVCNIVWHHLKNTRDILPMVTEHQGLGLASRGFVSLSFFRPYMEHLYKFHGYPRPEFYLDITKREFANHGKLEFVSHLEDWLDYLQKKFEEKPKLEEDLSRAVAFENIKGHKAYPNSKGWKNQNPLSKGYKLGDLKEEGELDFLK